MSSVPTIDAKILKLKQDIKEWEYSFTKQHNGVKPTHEDIKSNSEIQYKYKKYNKYKKELKYQQEKENLKTPTKLRKDINFTTPQRRKSNDKIEKGKEEEEEEEALPSPFPMKEIGPTPQLQGRVLSIFDIQVRSPKKIQPETVVSDDDENEIVAELPKAREPSQVIFRTPRKKRMDFGTPTSIRNSNKKNVMETPQYLRNVSSQLSPVTKLVTSSQEEVFKIGEKTVSPKRFQEKLLSTPQSSRLSFNVEPSPMLSPVRKNVKRKSLYEMMNELSQIQNDVITYEKEEEDLNKIILEENRQLVKDNQENDEWELMNEGEEPKEQEKKEDEGKRQWKRAKTQKRSTRRRKIKPLEILQKDEFQDVDIRDEMKKIELQQETRQDTSDEEEEDGANHNEMILNNLEEEGEDEESEESEEEEEEEGKEIKKPQKDEKFKLLNTNFVRMKIHYKNRGKFNRRRR